MQFLKNDLIFIYVALSGYSILFTLGIKLCFINVFISHILTRCFPQMTAANNTLISHSSQLSY